MDIFCSEKGDKGWGVKNNKNRKYSPKKRKEKIKQKQKPKRVTREGNAKRGRGLIKSKRNKTHTGHWQGDNDKQLKVTKLWGPAILWSETNRKNILHRLIEISIQTASYNRKSN